MAGKQVDLGIKLERIEGSIKKQRGNPQRRPLLWHPLPAARKATGCESSSVGAARADPAARQGDVTQARPHKYYTPLPVPLSQIYRQLLAVGKTLSRLFFRGLTPQPKTSDHCEYHFDAPGHSTCADPNSLSSRLVGAIVARFGSVHLSENT
ncbi:hypothetical protein CRG98_043703 [Punica granatum]|uniref:Uncharacterized protein n=1 Tax=Punica granatum TaxID=22663 RepID=A0A2I0HW26_PUNGR|nr:hypothetical protein CRG98_043703 [Punica granatum]